MDERLSLPEPLLRSQMVEAHGFKRHADSLKMARTGVNEQRAQWDQLEADFRGKTLKRQATKNLSGWIEDLEAIGKSRDPMHFGGNMIRFVMGFKILNGNLIHATSTNCDIDPNTPVTSSEYAFDPYKDKYPFTVNIQGHALFWSKRSPALDLTI
jgi:hypothetical protein